VALFDCELLFDGVGRVLASALITEVIIFEFTQMNVNFIIFLGLISY